MITQLLNKVMNFTKNNDYQILFELTIFNNHINKNLTFFFIQNYRYILVLMKFSTFYFQNKRINFCS